MADKTADETVDTTPVAVDDTKKASKAEKAPKDRKSVV